MAKIGFIGTGIMGQPMAANLQKAGHQLFLSEHHGKALDLPDRHQSIRRQGQPGRRAVPGRPGVRW